MTKMLNKNLRVLTSNPHFYSALIQSFLTGYAKPCEIRLVFFVLPIILYKDSRDKLITASSRSRLDTIFHSSVSINKDTNKHQLSGNALFFGFYDRYNSLQADCKTALIILSSEEKLAFNNNMIHLIKDIRYRNFEADTQKWLRAAFYLGSILSKTDNNQLYDYLGVDFL